MQAFNEVARRSQKGVRCKGTKLMKCEDHENVYTAKDGFFIDTNVSANVKGTTKKTSNAKQ